MLHTLKQWYWEGISMAIPGINNEDKNQSGGISKLSIERELRKLCTQHELQ